MFPEKYIPETCGNLYSNPNDFYGVHYRVVLDGTDGHIVEEEELLWQEGLKDREYDLKYY